MVTAVVLINVDRPRLKQVISDIMAIDGVTEVYPVAGEYDLVAMVRVKENKQMSHIIADIMPHHIEGITHTKTLIALDTLCNQDLSKVFDLD